nr:hypothetical protein [Tanacetum cinerariifolium]
MANQEQNLRQQEQPFVAAKQVSFNLEDIILNTNNEFALPYPEHTNKEYFKCIFDFISKCCLKNHSQNLLTCIGNTWLNFGAKPGAQTRHKKPLTSSKQPFVSSKVTTKGGSSKAPTGSKTGYSKKRKESNSTMDSNPSQPLVSTPVDTKLHKEDQQATGGPTSLGVISKERANPQLSSAQPKLKTLDALPSLLLNVIKALNKFAEVLKSTSTKAGDQSVHSAEQADTMPGEHIKKDKGKKVLSLKEAEKESTKSDSDDEAHVTGSMVESSKTKKLKKFDFVTEEGEHIHLTKEQVNHQKKLEEEAKAEAAKQEGEARKSELIDLLGPEIVHKYYKYKLQYDRYYDLMLNRRAESRITNCDVLTKKGLTTLKVYKEDGTSKVIPNFKASYLHLGLDDHARTFSSLLLAEVDKRNLNPLKQMRTIEQMGTDDEDAHEHVRRVLEIVNLFHFPGVTPDVVMLRVFPITLKGRALRKAINDGQDNIDSIQASFKRKHLTKECPLKKRTKQLGRIRPLKEQMVSPYKTRETVCMIENHGEVHKIKAHEDEGDIDVGWESIVKDVEGLKQFLTPTIHTLPHLKPIVQPYIPLGPVHDKEKIVRKEEHDYDIPLHDGVIKPLTPRRVHITPLDDDYVALATSPNLDKQLNKFGKECFDITRFAEKENGNLVEDVHELSDIKTYDYETFIQKLLHQVSQSSYKTGDSELAQDGDFSVGLLHFVCSEAMLKGVSCSNFTLPVYFISLMYNRDIVQDK